MHKSKIQVCESVSDTNQRVHMEVDMYTAVHVKEKTNEDWVAQVEELLKRRWREKDIRPEVDWTSVARDS